MSLQLINTFIAGNDGDTAIFTDVTGATASTAYGRSGNITYSDVDAIRIKIANLNSIDNTTSLAATDSFTLYVGYICTGGTGTVDGKALDSGDYFVPNTTELTVPSGMTFDTTGNYVYPWLAIWLPTAAQVPLTMSLAQINQSGNTTMEDSMYVLNYEIYIDQFTTSTAAVVNQQYLVVSGTCVYEGSTYRAGEIFIATTTGTITIVTATVAKLSATSTTYFVITYNMIQDILEILPTATQETETAIYGIRVQLEGLSYSAQTGNVSYT